MEVTGLDKKPSFLRQISFHLVSFCILMLSWHIKFSWLVYIIWQSQEGLSVD